MDYFINCNKDEKSDNHLQYGNLFVFNCYKNIILIIQ